jgi:hypothetical protein
MPKASQVARTAKAVCNRRLSQGSMPGGVIRIPPCETTTSPLYSRVLLNATGNFFGGGAAAVANTNKKRAQQAASPPPLQKQSGSESRPYRIDRWRSERGHGMPCPAKKTSANSGRAEITSGAELRGPGRGRRTSSRSGTFQKYRVSRDSETRAREPRAWESAPIQSFASPQFCSG